MKRNALAGLLVAAILLNTCLPVAAGGQKYYIVKSGDTLYGIGRKFGLKYRLIMDQNRLVSTVIHPGQKLTLSLENSGVHTVQRGETLYGLSNRYGTKVVHIKAASGLVSEAIKPGMQLVIPVRMNNSSEKEEKPVFGSRYSFDKNDLYLLAKLIHAEARGESLIGQIAVGAVIMNRLKAKEFPGNIREIIFQNAGGVYQFSPVQDGHINLEPDKNAVYAAQQAIKGEDPTGGAIFFYNPEISSDKWIRTLAVRKVIGNHVFAK